MAKREKVTMELDKVEAGYLVIELCGFRAQKKREKVEKLVAAKYFDPHKLAEMDKYSELVNDILVLMDHPDIDMDEDPD